MFEADQFKTLWETLAPLNATDGEHIATIEIWAGCNSGTLHLQLNWKKDKLEIEFYSLEEALTKAQEIISKIM